MKKKRKGFTLAEVLVAVIIGTILSVVVGIVLIQLNNMMLKQQGVVNLQSEFRFCKMKIERELRKATDLDWISSNANSVKFYTISGGTETISLNGGNIELKIQDGATLVLLMEVTSLQFNYPGTNDLVETSIEQEKITNYNTGATVNIQNKFTVKLRNKFE
ncbi:PilW family protein [Elusimicrobiota bacterium]